MSIFYLNQGFPLDNSLWNDFSEPFHVKFLKEEYLVDISEKKVKPLNFQAEIPTTFYPILINYQKNIHKLQNKNIDELVAVEFRKDWAFFFRGVHSLKEEIVLSTINTVEIFNNVMEAFGGKKIDMGESSYILEPLKGFFISYIFWEGDEDFPSSLKILFDKKLANIFMQDIVWGVIVETNFRLKNHKQYLSIFK